MRSLRRHGPILRGFHPPRQFCFCKSVCIVRTRVGGFDGGTYHFFLLLTLLLARIPRALGWGRLLERNKLFRRRGRCGRQAGGLRDHCMLFLLIYRYLVALFKAVWRSLEDERRRFTPPGRVSVVVVTLHSATLLPQVESCDFNSLP